MNTKLTIDIDEIGSETITAYVWAEGMKKSRFMEIDRDDFVVWAMANFKLDTCMVYTDECGEPEEHVGRMSEDEYLDSNYIKSDLAEYITIKQLIKL